MKKRFFIPAVFFLACCLLPAVNAERVGVYLVAAQSGEGPSDKSLSRYEADLRRVLRFDRFKLLAKRNARLSPGGKKNVSLAEGQAVQLNPSEITPDGIPRGSRGRQ